MAVTVPCCDRVKCGIMVCIEQKEESCNSSSSSYQMEQIIHLWEEGMNSSETIHFSTTFWKPNPAKCAYSCSLNAVSNDIRYSINQTSTRGRARCPSPVHIFYNLNSCNQYSMCGPVHMKPFPLPPRPCLPSQVPQALK